MKALVIGATGLVGRELVQLILHDIRFQKAVVFGRRSLEMKHEKLEEYIIDFDYPNEWKHLVTGDVLFSVLGSTKREAGSKKNQYKIDYSYQYQFAVAASENQVPVYVLISAASADPESRFFYIRMKGELERDVKSLGFKAFHIIQPGFLHGQREKERAGEKFIVSVLNMLNAVGLFNKYRPVDGRTVAKAMVQAAGSTRSGIYTYVWDQVFELALRESLE
jgi:uncharacterized protein YbjT (DUF2867 family)